MNQNAPLIVPATPHDVTHLDGRVERVTVHRLDIEQLYTFVELLEKRRTIDIVEMCTRKPRDWVKALGDEAYGEIAKACINANFARAMTLAASDPVIAQTMVPLANRLGMVARLADGLASSLSSAGSLSSPDGPGSSVSATPSSSSKPSSGSTSAPTLPAGSSG